MEQITKDILKDWNNLDVKITELPSYHQIGDKVKVFLMPENEESFPGITAEIRAVHFYPGKIKYDVELLFIGDFTSRIYNVDSALVEKINKNDS